jgi:hypothetical protein
MFLQPSEIGFLKHLKDARVPLVEFEFPTKRIFNIQSQLEKLIGQNYYLNKVRFRVPDRIAIQLMVFDSSLLKMATAPTCKHTHHIASGRYLTSISSLWLSNPSAG